MAMIGKSSNGKADDLEIPAALKRGGAKPSYEQLLEEIERLKASQRSTLRLKVSEKGAVSLYGLGRFPISCYAQQWERILDMADEIRAFIAANKDNLSVK